MLLGVGLVRRPLQVWPEVYSPLLCILATVG